MALLVRILILSFVLTGCAAEMASKPVLQGGDGEGIPGGDEMDILHAGDYYQITPDFHCDERIGDGTKTRRLYGFQRRISISRKISFDQAQLKVSECAHNAPRTLDLDSSTSIEFQSYNPDFVLYGGGVFMKRTMKPNVTSEREIFPSLLCRSSASYDVGTDIVIHTTKDKTRRWGTIYSGRIVHGVAEQDRRDFQITERVPAGDTVTYSFEHGSLGVKTYRIPGDKDYRVDGSLRIDGEELPVLCRIDFSTF